MTFELIHQGAPLFKGVRAFGGCFAGAFNASVGVFSLGVVFAPLFRAGAGFLAARGAIGGGALALTLRVFRVPLLIYTVEAGVILRAPFRGARFALLRVLGAIACMALGIAGLVSIIDRAARGGVIRKPRFISCALAVFTLTARLPIAFAE